MFKLLSFVLLLFFIESIIAQNDLKVGDTLFSHKRGYYTSPFLLEITTDNLDKRLDTGILYTLDGSRPCLDCGEAGVPNGIEYTGALEITGTTIVKVMAYDKNGLFLESNVDTSSYIFPDDVFNQNSVPTSGAHWYETMNQNTRINEGYTDEMLLEGLYAIPTISLSLDRNDIFEPTATSIMWPTNTEDKSLEVNANIEFIYPPGQWPETDSACLDRKTDIWGNYIDNAPSCSWSENCGLKLQGGYGRKPAYNNKHSFSVLFSERFFQTKKKLKGHPITSSPYREPRRYDRIVLRAGFNQNWAGAGTLQTLFTRDQFGRDQFARLNYEAQGTSAGGWAHLYINGLYWGLYNLVQRPDHKTASSVTGGTDEAWFYYKAKMDNAVGDSARYVFTRDTVALSSDLDYVKQYIDIYSLIDWWVYGGWGGLSDDQWYLTQHTDGISPSNADAAKLRMHAWDTEYTLRSGNPPDGGQLTGKDDHLMISRLRNNNPDFKLAVADRIYRAAVQTGGPLNDDVAIGHATELNSIIKAAIPLESMRWGDKKNAKYSDWLNAEVILYSQIEGREAEIRTDFINTNNYPSHEPPLFSQESGILVGSAVTFNPSPLGNLPDEIYWTTDGTDPKDGGNTVSQIPVSDVSDPPTQVDFPGTSIHLKARSKLGNDWSALHEVIIVKPQDYSSLSISEIHFNPDSPEQILDNEQWIDDNKDLQFIELHNGGRKAIDLSGCKFVAGPIFDFPYGTMISAGEYLVVSRNETRLRYHYNDDGSMPIVGQYRLTLDTISSRIQVANPDGTIIAGAFYSDGDGWPDKAAGKGKTLVPRFSKNFKLNLDSSRDWVASFSNDGSPGKADPATLGVVTLGLFGLAGIGAAAAILVISKRSFKRSSNNIDAGQKEFMKKSSSRVGFLSKFQKKEVRIPIDDLNNPKEETLSADENTPATSKPTFGPINPNKNINNNFGPQKPVASTPNNFIDVNGVKETPVNKVNASNPFGVVLKKSKPQPESNIQSIQMVEKTRNGSQDISQTNSRKKSLDKPRRKMSSRSKSRSKPSSRDERRPRSKKKPRSPRRKGSNSRKVRPSSPPSNV